MINKLIKIFISISILILSIVYVPPIQKEVVKDVYATVCDLSKPETCQKEIVKYLLALLGIRILTDDGVLEYVEDVIEYKNQNGSDLFSSWDIQAAANNQIRMSSQGLLTFFQDIFNFNRSKDIPWESGDLKYVNGNTIEFFTNSLKLSSRGKFIWQIYEGSITNNLKFYEILDHDINNSNYTGVGIIGNVSGKYTSGIYDYVQINFIPNGGFIMSAPETNETSISGFKFRELDINYYLEWAPIGTNYSNYPEDTLVLWQKSAFIKGSNNFGNKGNAPILYFSKTKNKMMYYTKEYADSLPLQGNIGMEDLPKSQQEFLDRFNIPSGIFDLQGIDLMQRDYHDFLEKIPLIYDQTFTETIPLPTVVPTVPPYPTTSPYPTSIPFPTSVPNDWAESVPLPPLELPNFEGDKPLTNEGAGSIAGSTFGWLGNAFNSLTGSIGNMLKALLNGILSIPSSLINGLSSFFEFLYGILQKILDAILAIPLAIAKVFELVIEFCKTFWDMLTNFFDLMFNPNNAKVQSLFKDLTLDVPIIQSFNKIDLSGTAGEPFEYYINWRGERYLVITTAWFEGSREFLRAGLEQVINLATIIAFIHLIMSTLGLHVITKYQKSEDNKK